MSDNNPENWTEEEWDKVLNSIVWCEVCGDGIGRQNYEEHLERHEKKMTKIYVVNWYDSMEDGSGVVKAFADKTKAEEFMEKEQANSRHVYYVDEIELIA